MAFFKHAGQPDIHIEALHKVDTKMAQYTYKNILVNTMIPHAEKNFAFNTR